MTDDVPLRLGPFRRGERLGAGGIGVVYAGVHEASGLDVALKVVADRGSRWRAEDEIRAVAGLDHPHVVTIFDHGAVDADRRWLAMELATGTLGASLPEEWDDVAEILGAVLDALGHAHARGLLHLDVKPDNVLVGCRPPSAPGRRRVLEPGRRPSPSLLPASGRPGLRLADFGLSRRAGVADRVAGTAPYMAPEQCAADGQLGPWTDLYAVGCLAWELVTGAPVFRGSVAEILHAHRTRTPGPFRPQLAVPPELEDWLRWLLDKDPARRPCVAADASHALTGFGEPVDPPDAPEPVSSVLDPSSTFGWDDAPAVPALAESAAAHRSFPLPPVPPDPVEDPLRGRPALLDAGLGLLAWRRLPIVGWRAERTRLWSALREARNRPTRVRLAGPPDAVDRVARWLGERAMASGAGWFVRPELDAPASLAGRPRVVWLDADPTTAADHLARAAFAGDAVLLLGTAATLPAGPEITLAPLDAPEIRRVLAEVLAIDPALAEAVAERTGGDADLALAWVSGLARDGQLVPGPVGWQLAPGATLALPAPADSGLARLRAVEPDEDGTRWRAAERLAAWDAPLAAVDDGGLDGVVVAELVEAGIVTARDGRRALRPGLETGLLAHARDRGRLVALHELLLAAGAPDEARRGLWLLRAGRAAEAVQPLVDALADRWRRRVARMVDAERALEALAAAAIPPADERWGQVRLHALWVRRYRGLPGVADDARDLVAWADLHHHGYVGVLARRVLGSLQPPAERLRTMLEVAELTGALWYAHRDGAAIRGAATNDAAVALIELGHLHAAAAMLDRVELLTENLRVLVATNRAQIAHLRGHPAEATALSDGLRHAERGVDAQIRIRRSDHLREAGRLAEARAEAARASEEARAVSAWPIALAAELRLVWVDALEGRPWRERFEDLLAATATVSADNVPLSGFLVAVGDLERARRYAPEDPIRRGLLDEALGEAVPGLAEAVRRGPWVPVGVDDLVRPALARMRAAGRGAEAEALVAALREVWTAHGCDADLAAVTGT